MHHKGYSTHQKFESLAIKSFGANLPKGEIHWMDAAGNVVAQGRCKAVISYAAADDSYMWLSEMAHYASVPTLPMPWGRQPYNPGTDEAEARSVAAVAAMLDGADHLYAAPTGPGSYAYLAVYGLTFTDGTAVQPISERERDRMVLTHLRMKAETARDNVRAASLESLLDNLLVEMEWAARHNLSARVAGLVGELSRNLASVNRSETAAIHTALTNTRSALHRELAQVKE